MRRDGIGGTHRGFAILERIPREAESRFKHYLLHIGQNVVKSGLERSAKSRVVGDVGAMGQIVEGSDREGGTIVLADAAGIAIGTKRQRKF